MYTYVGIYYIGTFYMLSAPYINITFDICTSNNIGISNIYAKIAGNGCQTSEKYLGKCQGV